MDSLPQELITLIASFIERGDEHAPQSSPWYREPIVSKLPPYATISQKWQLAIECRTFKSIHLTSAELLERAQTLIGLRRGFLSTLIYDVVLPAYEDHRCAKFETAEEMDANNEAFTCAIQTLFDILKTWDSRCSFRLIISDIYSPMDRKHRPAEKEKEDDWNCQLGKRYDLWEHRYEHSLIRLLKHANHLPDLPIISSLKMRHYHRHLEPRAAALLAVKSQQANVIKIALFDNQSRYPNNDQSARYDFATIVSKLCRPSLHEFELKYYLEDPSNHYFSPSSILLSSEPSVDHLSIALHTLSLSQNLTSLCLEPVVISPSIYWPSGLANPPTWPNLRRYSIEFQMTTPDGQWYFVRDPCEPVDDDEQEDSPDPDDPPSTDSDSVILSDDSLAPDTYRGRRMAVGIGDYPIRYFRTLPDDAEIANYEA
ncbi:MAG: hypothetical protein Q9183_003664 [Haloplaca sp. 2 TL-2023]